MLESACTSFPLRTLRGTGTRLGHARRACCCGQGECIRPAHPAPGHLRQVIASLSRITGITLCLDTGGQGHDTILGAATPSTLRVLTRTCADVSIVAASVPASSSRQRTPFHRLPFAWSRRAFLRVP